MGLIEIVVRDEKVNKIYGRATHREILMRVKEAKELGHDVQLNLVGIGLKDEDMVDLAELYETAPVVIVMEANKQAKLATLIEGNYLEKSKKGWQRFSKEFKETIVEGDWLVYQERGVMAPNRLKRLVKVLKITDRGIDVAKLKTAYTQPARLQEAIKGDVNVFQREHLSDYDIGSVESSEFVVLRKPIEGIEQGVVEILKDQLGE